MAKLHVSWKKLRRKNMKFTKFLFYIPVGMMEETREVAASSGMTISAFIRQSLMRGIKSQRATDDGYRDAKIRSAALRG